MIDQRKDEFLATLAHELRNPLAPIRHAAIISSAPNATDEQKRWSQRGHQPPGAAHVALLDDLLDISRITRGTPELRMQNDFACRGRRVPPSRPRGPLIDEKQHRLLVEMPTEPVEFAADPLRLSQVLSNLLTNAAKYTDPAGHDPPARIRRCRDASRSRSRTPASACRRTRWNAVFAMFSQVKSTQDRSEGGLGIGLALARALVQLHGGTIEAHSAGIGHGSEFVVRIPRRGLIEAESAAPAATSARPQAKRRVLIADDNRDAADEPRHAARDWKDTTLRWSTMAGRRLQHIESSIPTSRCWTSACRKSTVMKSRGVCASGLPGRDLMLIAVTGWGQEADRARAIEAGFDLHFTKPVEPERLIDLLRAGAPL